MFGDVPNFDIDPMLRFRIAHIPARDALSRIVVDGSVDPGADRPRNESGARSEAHELLKQTTLSVSGARYWELSTSLCRDDGNCFYRDGAKLF